MTNLFGLLWFDDDKEKPWQQKVKDAAARLQSKKWVKANRANVNYKDAGVVLGLNEEQYLDTIDGIAVYATYNTLRDHIFVYYIPPAPTPSKPKNTFLDVETPQQLSLL